MIRRPRVLLAALVLMGLPFLSGCPALVQAGIFWQQAKNLGSVQQYLSQALSSISQFNVVCVDQQRLSQAVQTGQQVVIPIALPGGHIYPYTATFIPNNVTTPSSGLQNSIYSHNPTSAVDSGVYNITSDSFSGFFFTANNISVTESLEDLLERNDIAESTILKISSNLCGAVSTQQIGGGGSPVITYNADDTSYDGEDQVLTQGVTTAGLQSQSQSMIQSETEKHSSLPEHIDLSEVHHQIDDENGNVFAQKHFGSVTTVVQLGFTMELSTKCQKSDKKELKCRNKLTGLALLFTAALNHLSLIAEPVAHNKYSYAYNANSVVFCKVDIDCPTSLSAQTYINSTRVDADNTPHIEAHINIFVTARDLTGGSLGIANTGPPCTDTGLCNILYGFTCGHSTLAEQAFKCDNDTNHAVVQGVKKPKSAYKASVAAMVFVVAHEIGHSLGCEPPDSRDSITGDVRHTPLNTSIMSKSYTKLKKLVFLYTTDCDEQIARMLNYRLDPQGIH